ncbi:MAG: hypothetical protein KA053_04590 [Lentimicrobiaceae bacterium]|nr:hypothetical protein [Lentimicrobiaceae bacterium]
MSPLRGWDGGLPNDLPYHYATPSGLGWRITKRFIYHYFTPSGLGWRITKRSTLSLYHPFGVGMAGDQTYHYFTPSGLLGLVSFWKESPAPRPKSWYHK